MVVTDVVSSGLSLGASLHRREVDEVVHAIKCAVQRARCMTLDGAVRQVRTRLSKDRRTVLM